MVNSLIVSVIIGVVWMVITGRVTLESFLVGCVVGLGISFLSPERLTFDLRRLPGQLIAFAIYLLVLARDILLSGIDVARRVLSPTMPLNLGIIAVETGDETRSSLIAALSADVITLTPGELVVDVEDKHILYVHCLDVEASVKRAGQQQAVRLQLFNRILGRSS